MTSSLQRSRLRALEDTEPWSSELALSDSSYTPEQTANEDISTPSTESEDDDDDDSSSTTPAPATRAEEDDDDDEDENAAEKNTTPAVEAKDEDDDDDDTPSPKSYSETDVTQTSTTEDDEDDKDDDDDEESKSTTARMNEIISSSETKAPQSLLDTLSSVTSSNLKSDAPTASSESVASTGSKIDTTSVPELLSSAALEPITRRAKRAACPCALAKLFERMKHHQ